MNDVTCTVQSDYGDDLLQEACELYSAGDLDRSIFNDPVFVKACAEELESGGQIRTVVFRARGRLIGLAVFRRQYVKIGGISSPCWVPATYGASDFTHFTFLRTRYRELWPLLAREASQLGGAVLLPHIRELDAKYLGTAWRAKNRLSTQSVPRCVGGSGTLAAVPKKKSLRRHTNGLKRKGDYIVTHTEHPPTALFDNFCFLHNERWRFEGESSKFNHPEFRALYERLLATGEFATRENRVLFTRVAVDRETVAAHIGFTWPGSLLYHIPVMNLAHIDGSPGEVLISELFRFAADQDFDEVNLGYGSETYKSRFSNTVDQVDTYYLPAFGSTLGLRAARIRRAADAAGSIRSAMESARKVTAPARIAIRRPEVSLFVSDPGAPGTANTSMLSKLDFSEFVQLHRSRDAPPYDLCRSIQRRFSGGYDLFALRSPDASPEEDQHGGFVSFGWIRRAMSHYIGELDLTVSTEEPVDWIVDCFTPPCHRGQGYYTMLLECLRCLAADRPTYIYARSNNLASVAGIERGGFVGHGKLRHDTTLATVLGGPHELRI